MDCQWSSSYPAQLFSDRLFLKFRYLLTTLNFCGKSPFTCGNWIIVHVPSPQSMYFYKVSTIFFTITHYTIFHKNLDIYFSVLNDAFLE
jgi:hypothetical protein